VADLSSFPVVICSICEKRVNVETSKTDEDGQAVHEEGARFASLILFGKVHSISTVTKTL